MRISFLIGGIALAAVIVLGLSYYWRQSSAEREAEAVTQPVRPPAPVPAEPAAEPVMEATPPSPAVEPPAIVLPALDESDDFVRERLGGSSLPEVWLERDDLLRRSAVVIENARRGEIPRRQLGFLAPQGKFQVQKVGETIYIDPVSYARYDRYLDMLESVPAESLAEFLADAYPLFDEALAELGATGSLTPQVVAAIDQILAVPVIRGEIELVQPKVFYEYADPALEELSPLQKQVLRMGPDNLTRLQTYLTALRQSLLRG